MAMAAMAKAKMAASLAERCYGSDDGLKENVPSKRKRDIWSDRETHYLITVWRKYIAQLRKLRRNSHVYARMRASLEHEHGFNRSIIEIKNKVMNLTTLYRKEKIKLNNGGGPSEWKFWNPMQELLENVPVYDATQDELAGIQDHDDFVEAALQIGDDNSSHSRNATNASEDPTENMKAPEDNNEMLTLCVQQLTQCQMRLQKSQDQFKLFQIEIGKANRRVLELMEKQVSLQKQDTETQKKMYTLLEKFITKHF